MDNLINEELERMKLLSNYDNSKTLSEQLKNNPADKFNVLPTGKTTTGGQPMVTKPANPADKFNVLPSGKTNPSGKPTKPSSQPTTGGQPMVTKQPTFSDKFNQTLKSVGQAPSAINPSDLTKQQKNAPAAAAPKPKQPATPPPVQLKDVTGVKSFQDWLDTNVPGWAKGYKNGIISKGQNGGGYGKYGPRTQKAWQEYGQQYLQANSPQTIPSVQAKELPVQIQGAPQLQKMQEPSQAKYSGKGPFEQ